MEERDAAEEWDAVAVGEQCDSHGGLGTFGVG